MSNHSLLKMAEHSGREARAERDDLRATLFPASTRPPSERQVAQLRRCLAAWVDQIERSLLADDAVVRDDDGAQRQPFPICWKALTVSGLLDDDILLTEAQNRIFLAALHGPGVADNAIDALLATLGQWAGDTNQLTADAAKGLLAAHLRLRSEAAPAISELPADLLHLLAWRIVAAHEVLEPGSRDRMAPCVADLLAMHDEGRRLAAAAERMAHRLIENNAVSAERPELWPERQGLPLTLALLGVASDMSFAHLLDLAREPGAPRLALVLRALDYEPREARRLIAWLSSRGGNEQASYATITAYSATSQLAAEQLLDRLRAEAQGEDRAA